MEINELSITLVEELLDEDIRSYDSSTDDKEKIINKIQIKVMLNHILINYLNLNNYGKERNYQQIAK